MLCCRWVKSGIVWTGICRKTEFLCECSKSVNENGTIPGGIFGASYNKQALKELISILSQIEGQNLQNSIDEINNKLDDFSQGVQTVTDTIDKAADLFNSVLNLFGNDSNNK